jgi:hypothetical protein
MTANVTVFAVSAFFHELLISVGRQGSSRGGVEKGRERRRERRRKGGREGGREDKRSQTDTFSRITGSCPVRCQFDRGISDVG